jgi:hypothetical protein
MKHLQNIGDGDIFNRKLFILDNSTMVLEDDVLNITGTINDKSFNYNDILLSLNTENSNEPKNISCKVIKLNEENYTLQCNPNNENNFKADGAFADLGNENLLINFVEVENSTEDDNDGIGEIQDESSAGINNFHIKKGKKLSTGGIVGIVLASLAALILYLYVLDLEKNIPMLMLLLIVLTYLIHNFYLFK